MQNYINYNLLVALYYFLIIPLPALTLAGSFILVNNMIEKKSKRYNSILMYIQRSWSDISQSATFITEKIKILVQLFVFVFGHSIQHDETSGYTLYNQTTFQQKILCWYQSLLILKNGSLNR